MCVGLSNIGGVPTPHPSHCLSAYPGGHAALLQRLSTLTWQMGRRDLANCNSVCVCTTSPVCASWGWEGLGLVTGLGRRRGRVGLSEDPYVTCSWGTNQRWWQAASTGRVPPNYRLTAPSSMGILPIYLPPSSRARGPTPGPVSGPEQKRHSTVANWICIVVQSHHQPLDVVSLWLQETWKLPGS